MDMKNVKKIIDDYEIYESLKEDSLRSMISNFYSRKMLSVVIFVWVWAIIIIAGAVYFGIAFFRAESTKDHIMYATAFLCCIMWVNLVKIWSWQMIHRNNLKREIKRLELRIGELSEALENK